MMMATALIAQIWVRGNGLVSINYTLEPAAVLGMLVFKNGSLSREQVRKEHCDGAWDRWEKMLVTWTRNLNL